MLFQFRKEEVLRDAKSENKLCEDRETIDAAIFKRRNGESENGNRESENGKREGGTGNGERGTGNGESLKRGIFKSGNL